MTYWLTESSLVPLIGGSILTLCLLGLAFSFRDRTMFRIGIVILLVTATITITEQLIVTDHEAIAEIVESLAVAVQNNDMQAVLDRVSDVRPETKKRIRETMPKYTVRSCRIVGEKGFEHRPPQGSNGRETAVYKFVAFATGKRVSDSGDFPFNPEVILTFEKEADGQWRITDYEYADPRGNVRL